MPQQYANTPTVLFISPPADLKRFLGRIMHTIVISLPQEIAEDLLNENKNRLVRTAINAATADPVLAFALEAVFTEALSKVESNASYKTIHHRRRMQRFGPSLLTTLPYGWVKGEDVGHGNNAGACSPAALRLCLRSPRSVGITIKPVHSTTSFPYSIAKYA